MRSVLPAFIRGLLVVVIVGFSSNQCSATQGSPATIGSLDLPIGGFQAGVTPAHPTIPKNVASGVQIVVTQNGQQLSAAQVAQYLGGQFQLVGQYSGPGLTQTIDVPQSPAVTNSLILNLPAVTTAGDYTLSNVQFLVNGSRVFDVTPSAIPVQVIDQVLVTSVETKPLTLDEIKEMGVVLDSSAYTGFQFTVGLQLSSQVVNITFPVVFDAQGVPIPQPLSPPEIQPPAGVGVPMPAIVPVLLQAVDESGQSVSLPDLGSGRGTVKIPSVIVIPGNVGYLKQFFSAQLYVTNGAPGGSNLSVDDVKGTINLPPGADGTRGTSDDPLALPNLTSGSQPPTLSVLAPPPGGGTPSVGTLNPGDTGQAQWTIRGDKEGYHTINFDIKATLNGLPTGAISLVGSAIGGVLVRNPYFNMTFTVPGVVRKGELFNVYATVSNISEVAANNLTVNFDQSALSGVTPSSSTSPVIPTLAAGDSKTLTFQFRSLQTGRVVASYLNFDTNDGTTGNLNFTLGVYANGTPMSPDTLVLPSAVDNLPSDLVDAAMRVLGQAWSVASAPVLPAGVTRTTRSVVNQKALLLAEAGLRQSLGEPLSDAVRNLALDFFSGSPIDPGFDQVLRTTPAGQDFVSVLGTHVTQPVNEAGGVLPYEAQLARIEASGPNFMSFAVGSGTGPAPVSITLSDSRGNQIASTAPGGSIVGGAVFPLGSSDVPYLGVVTSPSNPPYTLALSGQSTGTVDISISVPRGDGTVVRGSITGVAVTLGLQMQVVADFANPNNLILQLDTGGNGTFATRVPLSTEVISPTGPTLVSASVVGTETLSSANNYGMDLVLLFDRIVDGTTAKTVSNYSIPSNSVRSASKQLSGRLVFANLTQPEGPYVPTTLAVNGVADQRGVTGPSASVNVQSLLQNPGVVVTGRVLNPDGTPSTTANVTYSISKFDTFCQDSHPFGVAVVPVQSNGTYQFRYVTQDPCGGGFQISTTDPTTGALRQATNYVRVPGQQMVIDLALLGLGSVTGTVKDLSANPVSNAQVVAISGTDPQIGGSAYTDATGSYTINGITVGPLTVKAIKGIALGTSAGNIQRAGTTTVVDVTLNSGAVNVSGVVTMTQGGAPQPVVGVPVAYLLSFPGSGEPTPVGVTRTSADGSYSIKAMPAGSYSVTAYLGGSLRATQSGVSLAGDDLVVPLQVVIPTTGTAKGTVTFANGTPAGGVVVYQGQSGVLSNTDGSFTLPGISVLPSQSQTIYARTTDGLRSGQANVIVSSPTTPGTANITLSGSGSAQFTVLDPAGNPIAFQKVTIPDGSPNCGGISQRTDVNGVATFSGLALGSIRAAAIAGSDFASAIAMITQDGTTGYATMQFHGFGTVTGSVVDPNNRPAFGAVVELTSNALNLTYCDIYPTLTQSVQTDPTGKFRFNGVNVGKVGVTVSQPFYPTQVGAKGTLSSNGASINFDVQLVDTISGVLSGTVFLPDGVNPAGAGVEVTADGPLPNVMVKTDASGNFRFAKIFPEGFYKLTANDPVSGGTTQMQIYLRASQDMTQNLRLKGTGTVNVRVVDGAGAPVGTAFVALTETEFPNASFSGSLDASNQGLLPFPSVFEGPFSVRVTDPYGRGGRASGTLPQGISSVDIQVQLTTTGTVEGHFYMPDGTTPIPNASIQLTANGQSIGNVTSLGSGDVGSYAFQYVPAGPIQLKGQDPLTGRTGIAAGTISTQGQALNLNIKAQGLDTVEGTVTGNGAPQPGANVKVVSGDFQATTTADANGIYLMNGVPEGVIVATASVGNGYLSGTASAPISGDGKTLTLDVPLRNSGKVIGQVLMADGAMPAPASTVTIYVGGTGGGTENTTTDSTGNFALENVPAGTATISVKVLGGIDQASLQVEVAAGGITNVPIKLNGTGGISGLALDSAGHPTAGTIVLTGTGTFPYYLTLTSAADGTFNAPQVLAGPFTARLSANIGGFTLYGTSTSTVSPSQNTDLTVQVQSSGTVTGKVLRPDGQTPAVGAFVKIQLPSAGAITLQAQNDGTFAAIGVPLGVLSVQINDPSTMGLAGIQGLSLTSNGQTIDLGTITLDNNALSVVASDPTDGAIGIGVNQALTISFSEALANTNGIFVSNGSSHVYLYPSLSADGKTVTLQGQMPDGLPLVLNVTSQVTDIFGRTLLQPQLIHFTTADLTPPSVVSISPVNQAIQVPVNTNVVVTFNKALSTTALLDNVITLTSVGGPVPGTTVLTPPSTLTFTPASQLTNNARYNVAVNGAVSFGGNVQTTAFTSSFVSPQTIAPALQLNSPASGAYTNKARPAISISLNDSLSGINPTSGVLVLDGQTVSPFVGFNGMTFTPSANLADGPHTISASVQNYAGIVGTLSGSFVVDTVPPSAPTLTGITASQILKGQIPISASASDATSGVATINFLVDGTVRATLAAPSFSTTFNTATLSDGPHTFAAQAVDNAGTSGPASAAVQADVDNIPLSVWINSPATGAPFKGQVIVTATASEPVQRITFSLGTQTVTANTSPYQGTLSLSGLVDGPQTITATAYDYVGGSASSNVTINVDQTPPPAPNGNLIFAEPPVNGASLVHGLAGAVSASGLVVTVVDTASNARTTATSANDGSFATNVSAAVNDTLSLTATDVVGNVSAPTLITVRQSPTLPPSAGNTSLVYQGKVVDRVGGEANGLSPDGQLDAVFTVSLNVGQGVTRTISYISLVGPQTRSTQSSSGTGVLGVAADVGSPLLNNGSGQISFPITTGATLTLLAADNGLIQPGETYTVTAVFADGSQFVADYTIVAPADRQYVAHSATIAASPATVVVSGSTPGTTTLAITNIRDIDGNQVPDGARIALSAANMASLDPIGNGIVSAGGAFTDGVPATNSPNFQIYTILNGSVTATYSSQPVTPSAAMGALAVVQMQAADSDGNVLGTHAVATLDLNIRASADLAIVAPVPSSLFGDKADRRSHFTIQVKNTSGSSVPDGTPVLATATSCAGLTPYGTCISSVGGQIIGGSSAGAGTNFRLFHTLGGLVEGDYSSSGVGVGDRLMSLATIQVLASDANGYYTSRNVIGTATITIAGAGSAEVSLTPDSVPYVFPAKPVTILVHHERDMRANLAPDGSNVLVGVASCALLTPYGTCVSSAGGTITDGTPSPSGSNLKVFTLNQSEAIATYTAEGASAPGVGQASVVNVQVVMGDVDGRYLDRNTIAIVPLQLLAPANAVGSANPASILGDGGVHTSTVTFSPVLDAYGNTIPDGSKVIAAAAYCSGLSRQGTCINSAGGQITNGSPSPSGSSYSVLTVQNGALVANYADQGVASSPGQIQTANIVLVPADTSGAYVTRTAIGSLPVLIAGLTSASGVASPASVYADGSDQRTTVTVSDLRDAAGNPVPDGTVVGATAAYCVGLNASGYCISSAGGIIVGGTTASFNSAVQLFTVTNGQVSFQYSAQGVSVSSGHQIATVQILTVTPQGGLISRTAVATVNVSLLSLGGGTVAVSPASVVADGGDHQVQVVISNLLESDGVTPVPDGAKVGLTAVNCAARDSQGYCINSAGGVIRSAGTSPGDGTTATNNSNFLVFTIAGGQVQAGYSDLNVASGVNQFNIASVAVVPVSTTNTTLTTTAIGTGSIQLAGTSSAVASGPSTISRSSGGTATITFSGIKDAAGNTVPDGTNVALVAANCYTRTTDGSCNNSTGGTIVGGTTAPNNSNFKVFAVQGGSVTVSYSPAGASIGTATIQVAPAQSNGYVIGNTSLVGGTWPITVTN